MVFSALLSPHFSYLGKRLCSVPSSGLWLILDTGWASSRALCLLQNAYDYSRLCYLAPIFHAMITDSKLSMYLGAHGNTKVIKGMD